MPGWISVYKSAGVKADILTNDNLASTMSIADQLAAAGALLSVEGANEPNNFTVTYDGQTASSSGTFAPVAALQRDLYAAVKADKALAGIPVFHSSEAGGSEPDNQGLQFLTIPSGAGTLMPDGTHYADYANTHNYVCGHSGVISDNVAWNAEDPTLNGDWDGMYVEYGHTWNKGFSGYATSALPTTPRVTTETGWVTSGSGSITLDQQGKVLTNLFLAAFARGWSYTFVYMLRDDPSQGYWGFFDTGYNAKPSGTFLHNLTTLLADSGSPGAATQKLPYTVAGEPPTVHDLLLQKSSGQFELVVWDEKYSGGTDAVTVQLGSTLGTVRIYDPTVGTGATQDAEQRELGHAAAERSPAGDRALTKGRARAAAAPLLASQATVQTKLGDDAQDARGRPRRCRCVPWNGAMRARVWSIFSCAVGSLMKVFITPMPRIKPRPARSSDTRSWTTQRIGQLASHPRVSTELMRPHTPQSTRDRAHPPLIRRELAEHRRGVGAPREHQARDSEHTEKHQPNSKDHLRFPLNFQLRCGREPISSVLPEDRFGCARNESVGASDAAMRQVRGWTGAKVESALLRRGSGSGIHPRCVGGESASTSATAFVRIGACILHERVEEGRRQRIEAREDRRGGASGVGRGESHEHAVHRGGDRPVGARRRRVRERRAEIRRLEGPQRVVRVGADDRAVGGGIGGGHRADEARRIVVPLQRDRGAGDGRVDAASVRDRLREGVGAEDEGGHEPAAVDVSCRRGRAHPGDGQADRGAGGRGRDAARGGDDQARFHEHAGARQLAVDDDSDDRGEGARGGRGGVEGASVGHAVRGRAPGPGDSSEQDEHQRGRLHREEERLVRLPPDDSPSGPALHVLPGYLRGTVKYSGMVTFEVEEKAP